MSTVSMRADSERLLSFAAFSAAAFTVGRILIWNGVDRSSSSMAPVDVYQCQLTYHVAFVYIKQH